VLVNADPRRFGESPPVLEPFSVALLRQAALQTTNTLRRVDIPPGIAKKLDDTYVYTSARPYAPPFLEGKTTPARAEVVSESQKKQKLQFKDERREDVARRPEAARPQPVGRARGLMRANEAQQRPVQGAAFESRPGRGNQPGQGNQEERRQVRELERQNRAARDAAREQQRAAARAERENALRRTVRQRPRGERVSMPQQQPQQPNRAPRREASGPPQQRPAAAPQVVRPQREAPRPPQQVMRQQAQPQQVRPQPQAERRQGPPAHAGGGQRPAQAQPQQQGKGKGKGRP